MENNGCVEIAKPDFFLQKLEECKSKLPIHNEDAKKLFDTHHQLTTVTTFYENNKHLFDQNKLMVRYVHNDNESGVRAGSRVLIDGIGLEKELYQIDDSLEYYFFFNEVDMDVVKHSSTERQKIYLQKYARRMIRIVPLDDSVANDERKRVEKRKLLDQTTMIPYSNTNALAVTEEEEEEGPKEKKMRFSDDYAVVLRENTKKMTDMSVELALVKQEKEQIEEKHRMEIELMKLQHEKALQNYEIELLRLQQKASSSSSSRFVYTPHDYRLTQSRNIPQTLAQWTRRQCYPEQDLTKVLPSTNAKWIGFLDNPYMLDYCSFNLFMYFDNQFPMLQVPMTYYYPMRVILAKFIDAHNQYSRFNIAELNSLMEKCPYQYKVMLHMNLFNRDDSTRTNAININTILIHCQAILIAYDVNNKVNNTTKGKNNNKKKEKEKENAKICLFTANPNEYHPSIEIHGENFPMSSFFGPHSFISYGLGLRIANYELPQKKPTKKEKTPEKDGFGIGSGKRCAFCLTKERHFIVTTPNSPQFTHQIKTCPVLASLSNNEATILIALLSALDNSKKENTERVNRLTKKFLFETPFQFSNTTLLREATPNELSHGEHVGGIRLNMPVYMNLRRNFFKSIDTQLKFSDLFAAPHHSISYLIYTLLSPSIGEIKPDFKMSALLVSNDYTTFSVKSRLIDNNTNSSPSSSPVQQNDIMYFSLDQMRPDAHTSYYINTFREEQEMQKMIMGQNECKL